MIDKTVPPLSLWRALLQRTGMAAVPVSTAATSIVEDVDMAQAAPPEAVDSLSSPMAVVASAPETVPQPVMGSPEVDVAGPSMVEVGPPEETDDVAASAPDEPGPIARAARPAPRPSPPALPAGRFDAYSLRSTRSARAGGDEVAELFFPVLERVSRPKVMPPRDVAFLFAADAFSIGPTEMAILSFLDVYSKPTSPLIVATDEPIGNLAARRLRRLHKDIEFVTPPAGWKEPLGPLGDQQGPAQMLALWAVGISDHDRLVIMQPDVLVLDDVRELWTGDGAIVGHDVNDSGFVPRNAATGNLLFGGNLISLPASMRGPDAAAEMQGIVAEEAARSSVLDRFTIQRCWNLFVKDRIRTALPLRCYASSIYVLKCLDGSRRGICLMHDKGEDPWSTRTDRKA